LTLTWGLWSRAPREDQRRPRPLIEVEVLPEVSQLRDRFPHGGPGIRSAIGLGVDPLISKEDVLDRLA